MARPRAAAEDAAGGPGRASTCRWPTWTGRSTTWCRPSSTPRPWPGCRVRVRFAGRLVDGSCSNARPDSGHDGTAGVPRQGGLAPSRCCAGGGDAGPGRRRPVRRHAGRRAAPGRPAAPRPGREHAGPGRPERADSTDADPGRRRRGRPTRTARASSRRWPAGESPRAVLTALPGEDWPARLAEAVAATVHSGRRRGGRWCRTPGTWTGSTRALTAALARRPIRAPSTRPSGRPSGTGGSCARPAARRWSSIGTRAAAFAPVADLGLVAIWDDGDDLHAEPRAPYPHALQVLLMRAQLAGAGALVAATARSAEAQLLVETRWAQEIVGHPGRRARRGRRRSRRPATTPTASATRPRSPPGCPAWPGGRPGTPWPPARRCWCRCRGAGTCRRCPVWSATRRPGAPAAPGRWSCARRTRSPPAGGAAGRRPTSPATAAAGGGCGRRWSGAGRTAEELGRAFPGVPVRTSGRDERARRRPGREPALVVSTPGGRAGGRGRLRRGAAARHLGAADPGRPAGRRGDACAAGWRRPPWPGRPATAAGSWWWPTVGWSRCRRCCAGTRPRSPAGSWPSGASSASRRRPGWPASPGRPTPWPSCSALAELPDGAEVLGPVPVGEEERVLVRVPSRSAGRGPGRRAARRGRGAQRPQGGRGRADPGRSPRALVAFALARLDGDRLMDVGEAVGELLAGAGRLDPYPVYEQIRGHGPLAQVQERFFVATGYEVIDQHPARPADAGRRRGAGRVLRHRAGPTSEADGDRPSRCCAATRPTTPGCGAWSPAPSRPPGRVDARRDHRHRRTKLAGYLPRSARPVGRGLHHRVRLPAADPGHLRAARRSGRRPAWFREQAAALTVVARAVAACWRT